MIVLDTNVISEMMSSSPDREVLTRLDSIAEPPYITAISAAEIRFGIAVLPRGTRRRRLDEAFERVLSVMGDDRIVPFDARASNDYSDIAAARRAAGRSITVLDAMIAGICRSRGAVLFTGNTRDFDGTGVEILNPWID